MIGIGLDITRRNSGLFTAEYSAILARATTLEYTLPSMSVQLLGNDFIETMKANGVWDSLDVLYVFATDGDSDFATLNWKSPTSFQCTKVNSPNYTVNQGFGGDAISMHLTTGFVFGTDNVKFLQDDASFFLHVFANVAANSQVDAGNAVNPNVGTWINTRNGINNATWTINRSGFEDYNHTDSAGFWMLQRRSSTNMRLFKAGIEVDSGAVASGALSQQLYILCGNNAGVPSAFSSRRVSMLGLGSGIVEQETLLNTLWRSYLDNL